MSRNARAHTQRLETQIGELDKRIEQEVTGLKKLVGTSEGLLVLKTVTLDIEYLKETHVIKGVFEAQVRRLDDKIEQGLAAVSTRIEDLKAVRFWSKRTLLEVGLATWGAILTLVVAGIIEF